MQFVSGTLDPSSRCAGVMLGDLQRYFSFIYKTYTVDTLLKSLSDLKGPLCDTIMFRQRTDCYKTLKFFVESVSNSSSVGWTGRAGVLLGSRNKSEDYVQVFGVV